MNGNGKNGNNSNGRIESIEESSKIRKNSLENETTPKTEIQLAGQLIH